MSFHLKNREPFANKLTKGFSLLEMIIYIAILVFMLIIIMNITVSMIYSHRKIKSSRNIESSANVSLERISRETRQADSIDDNLSIFNYSPGKLVLVGTDAVGNIKTVEFYLSSSTIFMKENGVDQGPISQSEARVTSLVFRSFSDPTFSARGVKVEINIESGTSTYYRSDSFYSSATLR